MIRTQVYTTITTAANFKAHVCEHYGKIIKVYIRYTVLHVYRTTQ